MIPPCPDVPPVKLHVAAERDGSDLPSQVIDDLLLSLSAPSLIVGITADKVAELPELGNYQITLSMMELLGSPVLICQVISLPR